MECLEDNLEKLHAGCKDAINEYAKEFDEDPEVNEIFARACSPFWQKYCQVSYSEDGRAVIATLLYVLSL